MSTVAWLLLLALILTFLMLVFVIVIAGNGLQDAERRVHAAERAGRINECKVAMLAAEMDRRGFLVAWDETDGEPSLGDFDNIQDLFGDDK